MIIRLAKNPNGTFFTSGHQVLIPPMSFHGLFQIIVHDKFRLSVENQKDYQNVFTEHSNMKMKKWIIYKNKEPFIQNKRLKEVEKISC